MQPEETSGSWKKDIIGISRHSFSSSFYLPNSTSAYPLWESRIFHGPKPVTTLRSRHSFSFADCGCRQHYFVWLYESSSANFAFSSEEVIVPSQYRDPTGGVLKVWINQTLSSWPSSIHILSSVSCSLFSPFAVARRQIHLVALQVVLFSKDVPSNQWIF